MHNNILETTDNRQPRQILEDAIRARIAVINDYLDMDYTGHLEKYFRSVNPEGLTDDDKKVLSELIPKTASLIIPHELELHLPTQELFNAVNRAEYEAGVNLLIPKNNETPSNENIQDAVANLRAFVVILETLGIYEIRELLLKKLQNAFARMLVENGATLPTNLRTKIDREEYETLKLISQMRAEGQIMAEKDFLQKNNEIREGEGIDIPLAAQLNTAGNIRKLLKIYAQENANEQLQKLNAQKLQKKETANLYLRFFSRYPNLNALTSFLLDRDGKAEPRENV